MVSSAAYLSTSARLAQQTSLQGPQRARLSYQNGRFRTTAFVLWTTTVLTSVKTATTTARPCVEPSTGGSDPIRGGRWRCRRSEERRVGKECRSRWSPD